LGALLSLEDFIDLDDFVDFILSSSSNWRPFSKELLDDFIDLGALLSLDDFIDLGALLSLDDFVDLGALLSLK
jgi:ribosome-associated protein YbcJ (S4-like RNA binding protein)